MSFAERDMSDLMQVNTLLYEQVQELSASVSAQEKQMAGQREEAERQAELISCLTEMIEETMPIDTTHELITSVRAEVAEAERTALARMAAGFEKVEQQLLNAPTSPQQTPSSPAPSEAPSSGATLQQVERKLGHLSSLLDGAGRDILELDGRLSAVEGKRAGPEQSLAKAEQRLVALESAASRVSAEAVRRAEQSYQRLHIAERAKADDEQRRTSSRVDRLQEELETAVAKLQEHSTATEQLAADLDERAEDCSALLESSAELTTRLGKMDESHATLRTRQESEATEMRMELQRLQLKHTQRLEDVEESSIALRDWVGAENAEIAESLSALQLGLQQSYASRSDLKALAERLSTQQLGRSSSSSSFIQRQVEEDDASAGSEAGDGSTGGVWRVSNLEKARSALRLELEQCAQELRTQAANDESALRSICTGFESQVERGVGRLEQAVADATVKTSKLAADVAEQRTELTATGARCAERMSALETRVRVQDQEHRDELSVLAEQVRGDFIGKMGVHQEDFYQQCRGVAATVDGLARTMEGRIHEVALREEQEREELRKLLLRESESTRVSVHDALREEIKELEGVFKGVAQKWDQQAGDNLKKQQQAADAAGLVVSERIDAVEAAATRSVTALRAEMESQLDDVAAKGEGRSHAAEQAAAANGAKLSRELVAMIQRATEKAEATQAETARLEHTRHQEVQAKVTQLESDLGKRLERQGEAHSVLEEEVRGNHKHLSSRQLEFEAEVSARIEREYTGLHTTVVEGLSSAATATSAARGEAQTCAERIKAEMEQTLSSAANGLAAQTAARADELSRELNQQKSDTAHAFNELKALAQAAEVRVEEKFDRSIAEASSVAEQGRAALERGLEAEGRQSVSRVESAERRLTLVMASLVEDSAVAQGQALGTAVATLAADITSTHAEVLKQLGEVETGGAEQCAAIGAESARRLAGSCFELRQELEAAESAAAEQLEQLESVLREESSNQAETQEQALRAGLAESAAALQEERELRIATLEAAKEQLEEACAGVQAGAAHSLMESCRELRQELEDSAESLERGQADAEARAAASSASLVERLDEAAATAQHETARLGETMAGVLSETEERLSTQLEVQGKRLEGELAPKLSDVAGGLLSLAEAADGRHAELDTRLLGLERDVTGRLMGSVAALEQSVAGELAPMSERLSALAEALTQARAESGAAVRAVAGCETRLALQAIETGELGQALRELAEGSGSQEERLEERLGELQGEVAEVAAELSMVAALVEATATRHAGNV
jgi:hypothetical protein